MLTADIRPNHRLTMRLCLSARGRQMLDLLVVSLLTVAIVETRKAKLLRASGVALNSQTTIIHTKVSAKIHVNV
jgi:hypothetical protein